MFFKFVEFKSGENKMREYYIDLKSVVALTGGVSFFVTLSNGNRIEMSEKNYIAIKKALEV